MWTNLKDPEDFQLLKFAIMVRECHALICTVSPWTDEAANTSIQDGAFELWPVFYQRGKTPGWKTVVNAQGCIEIGMQSDDGSTYYSSCTPGSLRSTVRRAIEALEKEHKLNDDTPFWPICTQMRSYMHQMSSLGRLTAEVAKQLQCPYWLHHCIYWRLDGRWINEHPLTIGKLKGLLKRLPKRRRETCFDDQFLTEKRKALFKALSELGSAVKMAVPLSKPGDRACSFEYFETDIAKALREMLGALAFEYDDSSYDIYDSLWKSIIHRVIIEDHTEQHRWLELEEALLKFLDSDAWENAVDAVKMLIADPGMPDVRYYLNQIGLRVN